jgi:hypothetical protein
MWDTKSTTERAEGARLDGEGADRAIIVVAAMRVVLGHCPRDQDQITPKVFRATLATVHVDLTFPFSRLSVIGLAKGCL